MVMKTHRHSSNLELKKHRTQEKGSCICTLIASKSGLAGRRSLRSLLRAATLYIRPTCRKGKGCLRSVFNGSFQSESGKKRRSENKPNSVPPTPQNLLLFHAWRHLND